MVVVMEVMLVGGCSLREEKETTREGKTKVSRKKC